MGISWKRGNRRRVRTSTGGRLGAIMADDARQRLGLLLSSRDAFTKDLFLSGMTK